MLKEALLEDYDGSCFEYGTELYNGVIAQVPFVDVVTM
jgi:protease II